MTKPLKPSDVIRHRAENLLPEAIAAVNELLLNRCGDNGEAHLDVQEITQLTADKTGRQHNGFPFKPGEFSVRQIMIVFEDAGWFVEHIQPGEGEPRLIFRTVGRR